MNHEELEALIAARALGVLDPAEAGALDDHLASGCEPCARLMQSSEAAAVLLAFSVPPRTPPAALKERMLARTRAVPAMGPSFWRFAAVTAALAALILPSELSRRAARPRPLAQVAALKGTLTVDGREASADMALRAGTRLVAAKGAEADISFGERAVFRLKGDSEALIDERDGELVVVLARGWLMSMVKTGVRYRVVAPSAEVSALGTVFFVRVRSAERTYVCICRGRVAVHAPGKEKVLASEHHAAVEALGRDAAVSFAPGVLEDHGDADGASLEASWRR